MCLLEFECTKRLRALSQAISVCTCHGISTVVLFPSHHINEISKRQGSELNSPLSIFYEPVPDLGHGGHWVWWIS